MNPEKASGHFLKNGGFHITRRQLPRRWDYLLAGPAAAARFCQNGLVSLQLAPPAGRILCETPSDMQVPPLAVWIHDGEGEPFTHVFSPVSRESLAEPEDFAAEFLPSEVVYSLAQRGWAVRTTFRLDPDNGSLSARITLTNRKPARRAVRVTVLAATLNAPPGRHAWDPVGLYQRAEILRARGCAGVAVESRDPGGDASKRTAMGVFVSPEPAEIVADRAACLGAGSWAMPAFAVAPAAKGLPERIHGVDTVGAFAWEQDFGPRAKFEIAVAVAALPAGPNNTRMAQGRRLLSPTAWRAASARMKARQRRWEGALCMQTPDKALDDYANAWLPRQLSWVSLLDRGWATGLRRDGWFPRQVALPPARGGHDLRPYVDSGCWVVELLHDYLRLTGDTRILRETLPWLDGGPQSSVLDHLRLAVGYYTAAENRGLHGLVLIRGGDWNDAIHLAGVEGKGESVMTSCQAVLALRQAPDIAADTDPGFAEQCRREARELRASIRRASLNRRGFLRGVSTDDGRWIFSERDPDGRERINTAVQAWGIIAGVLDRAESRRVLRLIAGRRGPHGFRLFHPPLGEPPIPGVGRVASGDLMAGVAENGTVYNHGSQAFLARAAAAAGDGDMLMDILRWALPCYTDLHPTETARTPPYAIVNCWMETPGHQGEGGSLFLSGAVGVLRRVIIEGLLGFQPGMDGVRIAPCLPRSWPACRYALRLRGATYDVALGKTGRKPPLAIPWGNGARRVSVKIGGRP